MHRIYLIIVVWSTILIIKKKLYFVALPEVGMIFESGKRAGVRKCQRHDRRAQATYFSFEAAVLGVGQG